MLVFASSCGVIAGLRPGPTIAPLISAAFFSVHLFVGDNGDAQENARLPGLRDSIAGALPAAFHVVPAKHGHIGIIDRFAQLDPARFLSTPGLWTGLLLAAVFFVVAVRLRRYREPM